MGNKTDERKRKKERKRKQHIQEKRNKGRDTQVMLEKKKFGKVQMGVMIAFVILALGFIITKVK